MKGHRKVNYCYINAGSKLLLSEQLNQGQTEARKQFFFGHKAYITVTLNNIQFAKSAGICLIPKEIFTVVVFASGKLTSRTFYNVFAMNILCNVVNGK